MSTRRSAQALTQGKLTFGATKPTRITSNAKPKQAKTTSARNKKASSRDDITNLDDVHVPSSSSEDESLLKAESSKRAKDAEEPKRAPKARSSAKSIGERAILLPTNIATENLERPTLKERDPKYRKQYAFARGKLNNQRTSTSGIHVVVPSLWG
ncbi:hypothetical protein H0H87_008969 [Tephrocybe sp. NHM501043]|nr:hypothetical protein H0H87_008969 [Tephrocybe sp. NHM501043]